MDFALNDGERLTHLIECKETDPRPHRALTRFASMHPDAEAVQLVRALRQEEARPPVATADAVRWLGKLSA